MSFPRFLAFVACSAASLLRIEAVHGFTAVGFSYSVAGLLFPYHAGVTHKLKETNNFLPSTPINGASGGALAAACACASTISTDEALASSLRIATRCTKEGSFLNLERILRDELATMCTEEMVESMNKRPGPVDFLWTSAPSLKPQRSGPPFDSSRDLIDVLTASSHIPLYSSLNPITSVRGEWGLDGFLSSPPTFGCQPTRGADETVFITPFSSLGTGRKVIAPLAEEIPYAPDEYLNLALGRPGPDEKQHKVLFELGMKCASRWVVDNNDN